MKKILSIAALLLLVGVAVFAQDPSHVTELTFQVGITDPTLAHGELPRNLVNPRILLIPLARNPMLSIRLMFRLT